MASLAEIARTRTSLAPHELDHLQRLVASWGMLADFCFSDLLLLVPVDDGATHFVVLGQVRPTTSQTLYRRDLLGEITDEVERPLIARSYRLGEIIEGEITDPVIRERVRMLCIPVRCHDRTIAVLSRESAPSVGRSPGELERTYVDIFNRFARMIASGEFPYASDGDETDETLRVGDGCLVLDRSARVEYASPNAISSLHRITVHGNAEGLRLGELGIPDDAVRTAFSLAVPATAELEGPGNGAILLRCLPITDQSRVTAAVVLLRDVSELRRRDRLLLSKDATIREIHHRVKNNLQTISSLLRLQGRRLTAPEAKRAIEESVRRISSIALVHETLSREAGEDVPFLDIIRPLVRMVEESVSSPDFEVSFTVEGDPGTLPALVATPMSVVLNELLQNAVDHAFPPHEGDEPRRGAVRVELTNDGVELVVRVVDDGVGLPEGFSVATARGLGLSIVRGLVTSDLRGTIDMFEPPGGRSGTVVELHVPLDDGSR
ncbi:MAG: sensor histidine kinase [Actinobacteria bacterium]|nr:sensor histidine kinase [Actinomycetota bacterium]